MSAAGVVLLIAGTWVVAQVLGGGALGRLGLAGNAPPFPELPSAAGVLGGIARGAHGAAEDIWRVPLDTAADIARRLN